MSANSKKSIDVAIIGAGPAGLMAADVLASKGIKVEIFDAMPTAGRKFLMAGKSGLNISHNEDLSKFTTKLGDKQQLLGPALTEFNAKHVVELMSSLDIESFVGSSGRIFPKVMKTAPLLRNWLANLGKRGAKLHTRHKWIGWDDSGALMFETAEKTINVAAKATVLALGGASWPKLGSDAGWVEILQQKDIKVNPLKPANCGFDVNWSAHLLNQCEGNPVANVLLSFKDRTVKGSFIISKHGIEGGSVYTLSASLRDSIEQSGSATLKIDLTPDISQDTLAKALARPKGSKSVSNHIRRTTGIIGVKAKLLRECTPKETFSDPKKLAEAIKALPILLERPRPLAEAISTAGGISFDELDDAFMIKALDNTYCTGEMMDWEAPTGGYLITTCMATGAKVGRAIAERVFKT